MQFKDDNTLTAFLDDKPFYENNNCFCLGNTLAEAGRIIEKIVKTNEIIGSSENASVGVSKEEKICGLG